MVDVPPNVVGWVIGKAGARINEIQQRTNAAVRRAGGVTVFVVVFFVLVFCLFHAFVRNVFSCTLRRVLQTSTLPGHFVG